MEQHVSDEESRLQDPTESRFSEKLISLVSKNPELWDKNHVHYNDKNTRDQIWMTIADEMKSDCDTVIKRWRCLRYVYGRHIRYGHGSKGNDYKYSQQLQFLNGHVMTTPKNGPPRNPTSDNEDSEEQGHRSNTGKRKRFPPRRYQPYGNNNRNSVEAESTSNCSSQEMDEDELWLRSILPTLRRLTDFQKGVARLRIQQCLLEVEFGQNQPTTTTTTTATQPRVSCNEQSANTNMFQREQSSSPFEFPQEQSTESNQSVGPSVFPQPTLDTSTIPALSHPPTTHNTQEHTGYMGQQKQSQNFGNN